jgi:hypothetical protein
MAFSVEPIKAAQARWTLHVVILQEEERLIASTLEGCSRIGAAVPKEAIERLKASRAQCDRAFQALIAAMEHGAARTCN